MPSGGGGWLRGKLGWNFAAGGGGAVKQGVVALLNAVGIWRGDAELILLNRSALLIGQSLAVVVAPFATNTLPGFTNEPSDRAPIGACGAELLVWPKGDPLNILSERSAE